MRRQNNRGDATLRVSSREQGRSKQLGIPYPPPLRQREPTQTAGRRSQGARRCLRRQTSGTTPILRLGSYPPSLILMMSSGARQFRRPA